MRGESAFNLRPFGVVRSQCTVPEAKEHEVECQPRLDVCEQVGAGGVHGSEGGECAAGSALLAGESGGAQLGFPVRFPSIEFGVEQPAVAAIPLGELAGVGELRHVVGVGQGTTTFEQAVPVVEQVGALDVGKGDGRPAAGRLGDDGGASRGQAASFEGRLQFDGGDWADVDAAAATADGFAYRLGGGGDENEDGVGWRLFEGLEECRLGIAPQPFGGLDHDDAVGGFEGVAGDEFDDATDLADADVSGVGVAFVAAFAASRFAERVAGLEEEDIRVVAGGDEATGATGSAGRRWLGGAEEGVGTGLAVERGGELAGEARATEAGGPGEEERMGRVAAGGEAPQFAANGVMADELVHGAMIPFGRGWAWSRWRGIRTVCRRETRS